MNDEGRIPVTCETGNGETRTFEQHETLCRDETGVTGRIGKSFGDGVRADTFPAECREFAVQRNEKFRGDVGI
jgi:hypothetical protein